MELLVYSSKFEIHSMHYSAERMACCSATTAAVAPQTAGLRLVEERSKLRQGAGAVRKK